MRMKLGLLVVLAVAILVPTLSESRTVTRCDLKKQLETTIKLPWCPHRVRQKYLALVICEVERRSSLNTGLVRVLGKRFGKRKTTTVKPTTTTTTTATTTTTTTTTKRTTIPTTPPTNQLTTAERTTKPTTVERTTKPTTVERTTKPTTVERTTKPTTSEGTTPPQRITSTHQPATTIRMRRRREAAGPEPEQQGSQNFEAPDKEGPVREQSEDTEIEQMLKEEEDNVNEEKVVEDNYSPDKVNKGGEEKEEDKNDKDKRDTTQGGKRRKRSLGSWGFKWRRRRPWSLGFYGLFQLSDGHYCDSGYRWSRNVCKTSCSAFTDDDISDDIGCFVSSYAHWWYARYSHYSCRVEARRYQRYFQNCN